MPELILPESLTPRVVNLELPPSQRWQGVIDQDLDVARALFAAAGDQIKAVPSVVRNAFGLLFKAFDAPYRDELQAWADTLGQSFGTLAMVNCGYELDHFVFESFLGRLFACTAGVRELPAGPVHVRTLDWPIPGMGAGTRLVEFRRAGRAFISVGFPGFVGVLSGMVPGAYSVTINWAPPVGRPDFHHGPSFLLRRVLEECDTFDAAVHRLSSERLSTSVFYTACGNKPGQGCVIERTSDHAGIRPLESSSSAQLQIQANHHVHAEFKANNAQLAPYHERTKDPLVESTFRRRDSLTSALATVPASADLEAFLGSLSAPEVTNIETTQRMAFRPATGELLLDRFISDDQWARSAHRFTHPR